MFSDKTLSPPVAHVLLMFLLACDMVLHQLGAVLLKLSDFLSAIPNILVSVWGIAPPAAKHPNEFLK